MLSDSPNRGLSAPGPPSPPHNARRPRLATCRCSKQGAKVFSNSWGFPPDQTDTLTWSALKAAIQSLTAKGALVVFAAGAAMKNTRHASKLAYCYRAAFTATASSPVPRQLTLLSSKSCPAAGNAGMDIDQTDQNIWPAGWSSAIPGMLSVAGAALHQHCCTVFSVVM